MLRRHAFPPATPGGAPIRVTTSIGVVAGAPLLDSDAAALFSERADVALYAAKRSGRDRVRAWGEYLRREITEADSRVTVDSASCQSTVLAVSQQ